MLEHTMFEMKFRYCLLILTAWMNNGATCFSQDWSAFVGTYERRPVENSWHVGSIELIKTDGKSRLRWKNKAGVSWYLSPGKDGLTLNTDRSNPYYDSGARQFRFVRRNGKLIGFQFQSDLYVREGITIQTQKSGGFHGYISMSVQSPPKGYGYGTSFYVSVWPLIEQPLAGFQIGLPSTWIVPDNRDFKTPLCPPGTRARDNWPERGPYYRDVFQTIEGGLGYWVSTRFPSTTPKYRINGTPNGYNHEISSPGWGFGKVQSLPAADMGIAQLSNRLLIPPDGLTLKSDSKGEVLGNAWMVMDFTQPRQEEQITTGDQCWTLFLNAKNFKGPVAFWLPDTWSQLSRRYPPIDGRGLDSRPGLMGSGAMEVNTVPYFEANAKNGVSYSRIPKIQFPVGKQGETILMQDITFYSKDAIRTTGSFDQRQSWKPRLTANPISFKQGPRRIPLTGYRQTVQTKIFGKPGKQAFGLQWNRKAPVRSLPEYFKQDGKSRIVINEQQVPKETKLVEQEFQKPGMKFRYESQRSSIWTDPGPVSKTFQRRLNDGSTVSYAWYRFIDQPSIRALNWSDKERKRIQTKVEQIHKRWKIDQSYMPAPSFGKIASLDAALVVQPPRGWEVGYVPIILRQEAGGN